MKTPSASLPRGLRIAPLLLTLALAAAPGAARAADDAVRPTLEVSFGLGGASASESNIFNLVNDEKSTPDLLIDFRVRQNFTDAVALGFHIYGTTEQTPSYVVTDSDGNVFEADYGLTVLHLGLDVRYLFLSPPVQPFLELGVSYVAGSVEDQTTGNLQMTGGSVGGGPGIQFVLNRYLALGVQGLFTAGTAKWERAPFSAISTSRDYEPGFAGAEGFLTYRWRR